MKKALSIIMCYAVGMAALVVSAASPLSVVSSIDFSNDLLWGKTPACGLDDEGGEGSQKPTYWWYFGSGGNESVITNYVTLEECEARYDAFGSEGEPNPKPSYMRAGDENTGFLSYLCSEPLARTFKPISNRTTGKSAELLPSEGNDLFVDSIVQFQPRASAVTEVPEIAMSGREKIVCWLSGVVQPSGEVVTNFVVTAGRYGVLGELSAVNYVADIDVEAGVWYRLTLRAMANAATKAGVTEPAFALYLDGRLVTCKPEAYVIGDRRDQVDEWFRGNEMYSRRGLFPPMRSQSNNKLRMTGMAMQGRGLFDEFGMVNKGNPLAYSVNSIDVVVALNAKAVTNVICRVTEKGGSLPYFTTNTTDVAEIVFPVKPGDSVEVEPLVASTHTVASELSFSGNVAAKGTSSGYAFTMVDDTFEDASRLVARIQTGEANFRVGDTIYSSLKTALRAANDSGLVLKLENNVTLDKYDENGQMQVLPEYTIAFDLNGRLLKGEHFQEEATIYNQGRLVVYDSKGGGVIEAEGTAIETVVSNTAVEVNYYLASLALGDEHYTGDFTVTGRVLCTEGELVIRGGTYLTPPDLSADTFYLGKYVDDDGRFTAERVSPADALWRVRFDNRNVVRFEVSHGGAEPAVMNVESGATIPQPAITNAIGYTVTNWYVKGSGASWNFATDAVESNMTLVAQQRLDSYTITYDPDLASNPYVYTFETPKTTLKTPEAGYKPHFSFVAWQDATTGKLVDEIGHQAVFVGTEEAVTGNLALVAQWLPESIRWSNTQSGLSESNGTYAGSWTFQIPSGGAQGLSAGQRLMIDEISFCIVNPHLYPKTAARLSVVPAGGSSVLSVDEPHYVLDPTTSEYLVGTNLLANGRAKVRYAFTGLEVKVGEENSVRFCTATGEACTGFLRLALLDEATDPVFGKCTVAGGDPESEEYLKYCPVYEVRGHLIEEGGDE